MYKYERGDKVDENTTKQNEAGMHTHLAADMMRGAVVIASSKCEDGGVDIC